MMLTGAPNTAPPRGAAARRTGLPRWSDSRSECGPEVRTWVTVRFQYSQVTVSPVRGAGAETDSPEGSSRPSVSPSQ